MRKPEDLLVWQKSHLFVLKVINCWKHILGVF